MPKRTYPPHVLEKRLAYSKRWYHEKMEGPDGKKLREDRAKNALKFYYKNRDACLKKMDIIRQFVRQQKDKPCCDCGVKFHFAAMEFDHVRGPKKFELSNAGSRSIKSVTSEIEKCDVVCANCHAVRTYNRIVEKS